MFGKQKFIFGTIILFCTAVFGAVILFVSGNGVSLVGAGDFVSVKNTTKEYQYAAPWDKDMYESFYSRSRRVNLSGKIQGGIVPHHLLAGHLPAAFFEAISKQSPRTIVLISPNHFAQGSGNIISTSRDWETPFGRVRTDRNILRRLEKIGVVQINEESIKEEHGVYGLVPFIKKSLPNAKLLTFIIKNNTSIQELDGLVENLLNILPEDTVFVSSIDFSHYMTPVVADFHDELAMNVIRTFDFERLSKLEIDSVPSLYTLLKLMEGKGSKKIIHEEHTNSAQLAGNLGANNITSYYSPYFVAGESESDSAVSILHFGDMMLGRSVKERIDENGYDYLFEELAGEEGRFFSGTDIVGANLEGPFVEYRRETSKSIAFSFDPLLIPMLQKYNFSLFSQANNHSLDMGREGFSESKKYLEEGRFDYYGEQYSIDDDSMIIKSIGNKKVAFIGVNDTNTPINLTRAKELIKKAETRADFTVMNIHWGAEYKLLSNERQRYLAHEFVDAGVDVVIGHHPHVVQEMEVYRGKPIFYSLGNFIFDQYFSEETQQGLGVGLVLSESGVSVYLFPLRSEASRVRQMEYVEAVEFMDAFKRRSRIGESVINNFYFKVEDENFGK